MINRGLFSKKKLLLVMTMVLLSLLIIVKISGRQSGGSDPLSVVARFAEAVRWGDIDKAHSLVKPEQWERLDIWFASYETFRCPFSWQYTLDLEYNNPTWGCVTCNFEGQTVLCCFYYLSLDKENGAVSDLRKTAPW